LKSLFHLVHFEKLAIIIKVFDIPSGGIAGKRREKSECKKILSDLLPCPRSPDHDAAASKSPDGTQWPFF